MEDITKILLASGVSGIAAALVLLVFVEPAIKKMIEHTYDKLIEHTKTDQVLIQKRYDLAATAVRELAVLHQELLTELSALPLRSDESPLGKILNHFHPNFRARFRIIRSQLEPANDLLSFYSLSFDSLLHPVSLKKILVGREGIKSAGDLKYAYRSIWLLVIESLQSLLRVSASHKFWSPEQPYPDRARLWAEHERRLIVKHFIDRFDNVLDEAGYFSLQIEQEGGDRKLLE